MCLEYIECNRLFDHLRPIQDFTRSLTNTAHTTVIHEGSSSGQGHPFPFCLTANYDRTDKLRVILSDFRLTRISAQTCCNILKRQLYLCKD